jgi:HD-like signal output (HDOD) protein
VSAAFEDAEITGNREAFGFVQALATELSAGTVQLPSYPEAAVRLQRALSCEEIDAGVVVRAIGSEPALALRVMQMANSALLNPMGRQVLDLRTAVSRIGYNMVRTAAVAFIIQQLRNAESLRDLGAELAALWHEGVSVAAFSHVIARRQTRLNPDVALLAGLLQGVGRLYILTRLRERPALKDHPQACERILRDWQAGVARAILDSWGVAEAVGEAVEQCGRPDRELRGPVSLSDVLSVARVLIDLQAAAPEGLPDAAMIDAALAGQARFLDRLGVDAPACLAILRDAAADVDALHAALDL